MNIQFMSFWKGTAAMLPRKQLCLARNRLGMLCHCQALSSGRCHFHGPVSGTATARVGPSLTSEFIASFSVWGDLFSPAGFRRTSEALPA
jgi:hypothetical protein